MARRRPGGREGRRAGGDGIMRAMVAVVAAVPLSNAAVGLVRVARPGLLVATLAVVLVLVAAGLLVTRRRRDP
ncbi:hypothetical protein [Sphaerisporangium sp. TRM90804]|uniref:hypothetical protein n=1 Tax=Sphaerisporangium sp. TRM90804 TaxID=3031113 RepID=UPI002449925C|nr:hypothetical protein [Sphaerisporangium sp. TRM90804]MDH2429121.1 hypothetical protein [Sphaerisporangium sp. TRM90804]